VRQLSDLLLLEEPPCYLFCPDIRWRGFHRWIFGFSQLRPTRQRSCQRRFCILLKERRGIHWVTFCSGLLSYPFVAAILIFDLPSFPLGGVSASLWIPFYSFHELHWVPFEPLLAGHAAEVICIAIVGYLELGRLFVKNCAANRISRHSFSLNLT